MARSVQSTKRMSSRSTTPTKGDRQHRPEADLRRRRKVRSTAASKTKATGRIRPGINVFSWEYEHYDFGSNF